jgi:ectoine hydroxylase-related dioxygenase (phytanoyl-CoA dioxygenase family)
MQGYLDPSNPAYADHPDQLAVPVKAGDVLVGDARLIHSAFANRTSEERPLLTLWYMPHWSAMPAPMRALAYKGFMRGDDIRSSVAPARHRARLARANSQKRRTFASAR